RQDGHPPAWWDERDGVASDARDYYTRWLGGVADGVLVNMPVDVLEQGDRARFFDHLAGLVARATGPFDIPALFPWGAPVPDAMRENWRSPYALGLDVVYFEGPAYLRWPEDRKREWGAIAMQVPRLAGYGDGGPGRKE
ncbi:MAG TPA: hypothetical protein VLD67_01760, partial [Vicinamibacterales bacterium]|nr:hypothetical protein [Vicinamibacterales bacterium]